ncbi:phosphotransferase enzyme family protein [Paenibacillus sp. WLX1005]|uniref:phosphotransferase enzyme family protein n=1 Tax=Paenibacillus sp. WLX1005 TaxID=3243766 RepID=UPI00398452EA
MNPIEILQTALKDYTLDLTNLKIVKELHSSNWHGDLHFQIYIDHRYYAARFVGTQRYETDAFIKLSDEVLHEQMRFCNFLIDAEIPFMKPVATIHGDFFVVVAIGGEIWRFLLFEWMEGQHITHGDTAVSRAFGVFTRKLYHVSTAFETSRFPRQSHVQGYTEFYNKMIQCADAHVLLTNELLKKYMHQVEYHLEQASTHVYEFIVQSDLNPLNILWDDHKQITGIVDFESITYTDRLEGLAWLIKWYSRIDGIGAHMMSPVLAQSFLQGYGADNMLTSNDRLRLRSLTWLTGCLNWNFTQKTLELIKTEQEDMLKVHLTHYSKRGEQLLALI